jgi:glutathione synthase/RimK-type ligase-like ATP-grasp enzyme
LPTPLGNTRTVARSARAPFRIAVGRDALAWHERFIDALESHEARGQLFDYELVSLDGADWKDVASRFDVILWKPAFMGPEAASHYKEKIYFLEHYLRKLTVPNFSTIWHFESKIAQSFIFDHLGVPTPRTSVSFDYHDAAQRLRNERYPIVMKDAFGAGSNNVHLVSTPSQARSRLKDRFASQLSDEARLRKGSRWRAAIVGLREGWLWPKVRGEIRGEEHFRYAYWQEFIRNNPRDLRITIIGDRYATGFWRGNRPNDFRASGSGRIDHSSELPLNVIEQCIDISRQLDCDSMAYDILFTPEKFVVVEMSYAYLDSAVQMRGLYFRREDDGTLTGIEEKVWPQTLWVAWVMERIQRQLA